MASDGGRQAHFNRTGQDSAAGWSATVYREARNDRNRRGPIEHGYRLYGRGRDGTAEEAWTASKLTRRTDANAGGGSGPRSPPPPCLWAPSRTARIAVYSREPVRPAGFRYRSEYDRFLTPTWATLRAEIRHTEASEKVDSRFPTRTSPLVIREHCFGGSGILRREARRRLNSLTSAFQMTWKLLNAAPPLN